MRLTALLGTAAAALFTSTTAFAVVGVAPDQFAPGEREHRIATAAAQQRLNDQPAWQDFLARHGGTWTALWDEATRTPVRFWGTGWEVDASKLADDDAAFRLGMALLAQEADLLGVTPADLAPLAIDRGQGITTLSFARTWQGLPVQGARVSLRFKHGRFVMGQFESMPDIDSTLGTPKPVLSAEQSVAVAVDAMEWDASATRTNDTHIEVYPVASASSVEYRLAWALELASTRFPSRRHAWVDALTGEFLGFREQVRFLDGQVRAEHDNRWPENGMTDGPLAYAQVTIDGVEASADADGVLSADAGGLVQWSTGSRYFRVRTADGQSLAQFEAQWSDDGDELVAVVDPELDAVGQRRVLAQLDTHVASHWSRERALRINPNFAWASQRVDATVNSTEMTCNAWFDGDINFVQQGDGCNNTGRVMDVVAHEYGHGFHAYSIINGVGSFDGALSEGMGDYLAATISGDPATARGFFEGSDQPLRDIEIDRVWPEDVGEIHQTGRIIAGALWDARKALVADLGEQEGVDHADQLFRAIASRASDIPTGYAEAILADDDNGNLGDGTPNGCLIDDAFGIHGLGPAADAQGLFSVEHAELTEVLAPSTSFAIATHVELSRPDCTTGEVGEVNLYWTVDGDSFEVMTMESAGAGDYLASLPGFPNGTEVRYFIEVVDGNGDVSGALPRGSVTDPWYAAWVGQGDVFFFSDFESDDGGFTHELIQGNAESEGADDWQWGTPQGDSGDPTIAFSGNRVWGNDLTPEENWNGAYQRNVHNALHSPSIDVSGTHERIYLQYRRWLTVEDGFFDSAQVSVNGIQLWEQFAGTNQNAAANHHEDTHWALRTYEITDLVAADGTVRISWELMSDGGLQLGGWNIDDVAVFGIGATPEDIADEFTDGGCACDATGDEAPTALLLLPLFGLVLRRRYSATMR